MASLLKECKTCIYLDSNSCRWFIEPKEIPIPEGVILDESLLDYMNMAEKQRLSTMSFINSFLSQAGFNYRADPLQTVGTLR